MLMRLSGKELMPFVLWLSCRHKMDMALLKSLVVPKPVNSSERPNLNKAGSPHTIFPVSNGLPTVVGKGTGVIKVGGVSQDSVIIM